MRPMVSLLPLAACCLPAVVAGQAGQVQVSARFVSTSQLKTSATDNSNKPHTKTAPANTNLFNGLTLEAGGLGSKATYLARIDGSVDKGWLVRMRDTAAGTYPTGYTGGSAITGPNKTQLVLTTNRTVPVRVIVSLEATTNYTALVDIGADGKVDFTGASGTSRKEFLVTLPAKNGLKIDITTAATTGGRNIFTFWGELHVDVRPRCEVKEIGKGCGSKPALAISPTFNDSIEMQVSDAFPLTTVVLGVGTRQTNVLLPGLPALGPPCPMHTDLLVMQFLKTDIFGALTLKVPVPNGVRISGNVQMFTITPFGSAVDIRSTPAFNVTCK